MRERPVEVVVSTLNLNIQHIKLKNVSPKESGERAEHRTIPDSDMGRVQRGVDRSRLDHAILHPCPHPTFMMSSGL